MLKWFHHQAVESMPTDCIWKWRNFSFIWFGEYMNDNDFYQTDIIQCWRIDNFTHIVHNCNFQEEDEWHCMISLEVKYQKNKVRIFDMLFIYNIICLLFVCINSTVLFYSVSFPIQEFIPFVYVVVEIDSCWQNFAKTDVAFKMAAEFWQNEMFRCSKACLRGSRIAVKLLRMWFMYCKTSQVTFPVVYKQMWFLMVIGGFLWVSSATLIQQHLLLQWQLTAAPLNQLFLFCLNTNPFLGEI